MSSFRSIRFRNLSDMAVPERVLLDRLSVLTFEHFMRGTSSEVMLLAPHSGIARSAVVNFADGEHPTGEKETLVFVEINLLRDFVEDAPEVQASITAYHYVVHSLFSEVAPLGDYYGRFSAPLHQIKLLYKLKKD